MNINRIFEAVSQTTLSLVDESSDSDSSSDDEEVIFAIFDDLLQEGELQQNARIKKVENYVGVISVMSWSTFKSHFRLTRASFEVVRNAIEPLYRTRNVRADHHGIAIDKALLLTIWTLANPESFRGVSDRFDVSKSIAHKYFLCISNCLQELATEFLHWPSVDDFKLIRDNFSNLRDGNNFPNVVGVVDGMHIPIPAPKDDPGSYYNRKGFHSILLQGICDAEYKFIDIFVGWPGSSHDARVWRESPVAHGLSEEIITVPEGTHILGDSAYPLLTYLMTPFRDNGHLTRRQKNYNKKLSSKRIVIEQAFGMLKGRFRRLKYLNMSLMTEMKTVVIASCVLHNICIKYNDNIDADIDEAEAIDAIEENNNEIDIIGAAADKRNGHRIQALIQDSSCSLVSNGIIAFVTK